MHRFSFSFSKVGIPPLKINIFQRFEYRKNRAVSAVLMVFETLTHIDFQGGGTPIFFLNMLGLYQAVPQENS